MSEPGTMDCEGGPLHTASGIATGCVVSGVFWGLVGVAAWLVI